MRLSAVVLAALLLLPPEEEPRLYDPYERPKNGPPLTNVFHKMEVSWIWAKIRSPKHHPSARMPEFDISDKEALDIMAYLKSIADPSVSQVEWPDWAAKGFDEMEDDEAAEVLEVAQRGEAVWGTARCTICHQVNGPGGQLIGGFVDLRVGGTDLQIAAPKLKRDWLFHWIKDPKTYFPDTLMPRYRLSDDEIKALVEFILRDDAFEPPAGREPEDPERWKALDDPVRVPRGKRLIEISRCVVCHDIKGIPEVFLLPRREVPPKGDAIEWIAYDLRCLTCHAIAGRGGTYAPELAGVGGRLREAWIAEFVRKPDLVRPLSQQMPKFNLSTDEAEAIAAYFERYRRHPGVPSEIPGGDVRPEEIQQGHELYKIKGCVACHSVGEGPGGVVGPDLTLVAARLREGYLWFHLEHPHAISPYSAEPDYDLSEAEARALAAYLSEKKE